MVKNAINDDFEGEPSARWTRWLQGAGRLENGPSTLRMLTEGARAGQYSDAQLDDYHGPAGRRWLWRPPVRMQVRARASHPAPAGTAGFGFWNDPFTLSGWVTALPEAVWFFYASPPANMALVPGVPGHGWKAAVVHASRPGAFVLGVPTAAAVLGAMLTGRAESAARWVQRISGAHEALLPVDWTEWHMYELDWQRRLATFSVDGQVMLQAPNPPRGPLGFVAWIDNQYAVATPRGEFRFGTLDAGPQWLELDEVRISNQ